MGCDIHPYLEFKKNGEWYYLGEYHIWRNYLIFGILAGVREENVERISDPRGYPADISAGMKAHVNMFLGGISESEFGELIHEEIDYHSISHVYYDEIIKAENIYNRKIQDDGMKDCNIFDNLHRIKEKLDCDDMRLIFYFDN